MAQLSRSLFDVGYRIFEPGPSYFDGIADHFRRLEATRLFRREPIVLDVPPGTATGPATFAEGEEIGVNPPLPVGDRETTLGRIGSVLGSITKPAGAVLSEVVAGRDRTGVGQNTSAPELPEWASIPAPGLPEWAYEPETDWETVQNPYEQEGTVMAQPWGDFISGIGQRYITDQLGLGGPQTFAGAGIPASPAPLPAQVTVDTRTGQVKPCRRRRRRRLLTPTDLADLAALQALVGKGSTSLNLAVAKAVRR